MERNGPKSREEVEASRGLARYWKIFQEAAQFERIWVPRVEIRLEFEKVDNFAKILYFLFIVKCIKGST